MSYSTKRIGCLFKKKTPQKSKLLHGFPKTAFNKDFAHVTKMIYTYSISSLFIIIHTVILNTSYDFFFQRQPNYPNFSYKKKRQISLLMKKKLLLTHPKNIPLFFRRRSKLSSFLDKWKNNLFHLPLKGMFTRTAKGCVHTDS